MRGHAAPPTAFKPGHTIQPTPEQRPTSIRLRQRQQWARDMRQAMATGIPPAQVVEWIYEGAELGRQAGEGKVLLQAAELALYWLGGKPGEQLSEREQTSILDVIEKLAALAEEKTIEGEITETKTISTDHQDDERTIQ